MTRSLMPINFIAKQLRQEDRLLSLPFRKGRGLGSVLRTPLRYRRDLKVEKL